MIIRAVAHVYAQRAQPRQRAAHAVPERVPRGCFWEPRFSNVSEYCTCSDSTVQEPLRTAYTCWTMQMAHVVSSSSHKCRQCVPRAPRWRAQRYVHRGSNEFRVVRCEQGLVRPLHPKLANQQHMTCRKRSFAHLEVIV